MGEHYRQDGPSGVPGAGIALRVPDEGRGMRVDAMLARLLPQHSRSRIRRWIDAGRVRSGGRAVSPSDRLEGGEVLVVDEDTTPSQAPMVAEPIPLSIVHEDADVIVIDKPAGLVVHPGAGNRDGTLQNALLHHDPRLAQVPRSGIVHRLDKDTSGLMVVARTEEAQTDLVRQLQARTVSRRYLALAWGKVERNVLVDAPIGRHPTQRTTMAVVARGKPARTHVDIVRRFATTTLVRCRLETGRTHQIRVHLAAIGHPLVGDPVYGSRKVLRVGEMAFVRQALHAEHLAFIHPGSRVPVVFDAPVPADLEALLASLEPAGLRP